MLVYLKSCTGFLCASHRLFNKICAQGSHTVLTPQWEIYTLHGHFLMQEPERPNAYLFSQQCHYYYGGKRSHRLKIQSLLPHPYHGISSSHESLENNY